MTLQRIREICLALPDATEQIQWGKDLVFKIGGKMFCVACTEPVTPPKVALSFKCDEETFADLVERDGVIPAPYMAQHKWVAPEQFDTLGAAELEKLIARAYQIVSAKLPSTRRKTAKTRSSRSLRVKPRTAKKAKTATKSKEAKAASKSKPARRAGPERGRRAR